MVKGFAIMFVVIKGSQRTFWITTSRFGEKKKKKAVLFPTELA
jgi:hypothetical protein